MAELGLTLNGVRFKPEETDKVIFFQEMLLTYQKMNADSNGMHAMVGSYDPTVDTYEDMKKFTQRVARSLDMKIKVSRLKLLDDEGYPRFSIEMRESAC